MSRRALARLVSIALAASTIAACGSGSSSSSYKDVEEQIGLSHSGIVERQSRVEGVIRDCMKAQGFGYIPVDPLAQRAALTGKSRMSDEEFMKQFGYGISTMFGRGNAQSEPNDRNRKRMNPTDRAAYDRALWGDNPGETFAQAVDTGHFESLGGCTKQATEAVFGGAAVLATLQGKLDELDTSIAQDGRMVRAMTKWSACMARAGYRYTEGDEVDGDLLKRFEAVVGVGVRPGATVPPSRGTSYDRAALAALQREEVTVANTDLACEKQNVTPVESIVRPQYEAGFRRQYQGLLARVGP
jgi:hypothetical protein